MKRWTLTLAWMLLLAPACGDDDGDVAHDATAGPDTGAQMDTGVAGDTGVADTGVGVDGGTSGGCGLDPTGLSTTLDVGGQSRTFVLYLPPGYDQQRAYPLVFAWHGLGGSGQVAQSYFGIQQQVGGDAVIVYPDGLPLPDYGGDPGWELNPAGYDFQFFDALLSHLLDNLCVDASRVFSTGHSFGGYMSNSLGCYRGSVLRAIAPVAGGPPFFGACDGALAAWLTHGTADTVVELAQGESARNTWLAANGCAGTSTAVEPTGCVAYDGCAEDVHWCAHPGGHEWPPFAASAIWAFFEAQ